MISTTELAEKVCRMAIAAKKLQCSYRHGDFVIDIAVDNFAFPKRVDVHFGEKNIFSAWRQPYDLAEWRMSIVYNSDFRTLQRLLDV